MHESILSEHCSPNWPSIPLGLAPVAELLQLLGETPRCDLIVIDTTLPFFTSLLAFHSFIALILTHCQLVLWPLPIKDPS